MSALSWTCCADRTLKAFGRSAEQVGTMRAISRQFGETTLEVLRSAFQTGPCSTGPVRWPYLVAVEVSLRHGR